MAELRAVSPPEVAFRILEHRFGEAAEDEALGPAPVFDLARFQEDAVRRAEQILARRRGVLVADSVGLGKTYVALALVERALRRGARVAVVTPAALRREWHAPLRRLCERLGVGETYGLAPGGDRRIERVAGDGLFGRIAGPGTASGTSRSLVAWVSHTRLSRGSYRPDRLAGLDLVVVDEAHAFRTPHTRRYRALAGLCRGAHVVLITATPVNNALSDLYVQLRLFAGDGAFRDVGVPDLGEAFRAAAPETEGGAAPPSLVPVLRAVMIRRTRPFLREHYRGVRLPGAGGGTVLTFPRRAPPAAVRYALDAVYPELYAGLAAALESLTLAPLRLAAYGAAPGRSAGADPAELVRIGLLKRLESSVAAFRASIARQVRFYEAFLAALGRGRLLAPPDHRALYSDGGDGDVVQLVLEEVALGEPPPGADLDRLAADARGDAARLGELHRRLAELRAEHDPKLARLRELLDGELRGEKVVVFTEFRDTARHLWRALLRRGGTALVDGGGAFLGASPCGRREAIERFAPRANGVAPPPARERVELLIATDVLAEGLNLQDAAHVVSYDLPWNPVRLIQRVGRVDRLGSPFETVHSYHFLPDRGLERLLRLLDRLRAKLAAIGRTVGGEAAVLGDGDIVARDFNALVDRLAAGDPEALEAIERSEAAPFEVEERLRTAYAGARAGAGDQRGRARREGPVAAAVASPSAASQRVLLAFRVEGRALWLVADPGAGCVREDDAAAAEILLGALAATPGEPLPLDADAVSRALRIARAEAGARLALVRANDALPPRAPGAVAARRLLATLGAIPGGPDPALCRRADAVLAALARRHDAGTEAALSAVLGQAGGGPAEGLLDALERALGPVLVGRGSGAGGGEGVGASSPSIELVGILELRPAVE